LKCIPGSHKPTYQVFEQLGLAGEGFADFAAEKQLIIEKSGYGEIIDVPPGHILIFNERMVHTVMNNGEEDGALKRFHTSFVISSSEVALHDRQFETFLTGKLAGTKRKNTEKTLVEYFGEQLLVPVRSGQGSPTYTPFHNFPKSIHQIDSLSLIYARHCLVEYKESSLRVARFLPSMREMQESSGGAVVMHRPMTQEDVAIYLPRKISSVSVTSSSSSFTSSA